MNNIFITIFTPTYNRESTLERLYNSLLSQSCKNFEWLVVDDGSSDNTESLIAGFIKDNIIDIKYHKQENGGKHRAINKGLDHAVGDGFFIVDSDDYLESNAIELINKEWVNLDFSENIMGLKFRKRYENGETTGSKMPNPKMTCTVTERNYKYFIKGDFAAIIKTDILKQYKFPDIENEYFCAEGIIWHRLSLKYKVIYFDIPIYICEYLPGGLTDSSVINRRKSKNYILLTYKELIVHPQIAYKIKIKSILNFWRFYYTNDNISEDFNIMIETNFLSTLLKPIGFLISKYDNYKINKKNKNGI